MDNLYEQNVYNALKQLRHDIPRLIQMIDLDHSKDIATWVKIVDIKLLTRLTPDFPLMATICGGGSSGKSTLFNTLVGENLSPVGGSAGINRRVLVSANRQLFTRKDILSYLFEPFGCLPDLLKHEQELAAPGCPLYAFSDVLPQNLVLMDTPDFDTGAKGIYINRDVAQQALESSDILIYIFTNSNYNNRENTDFISEMLTGMGMRKCFLIYRVYPSFEDEEVMEHASTVAHNLYGKKADHYVMGIYRTDEDNAVAAGKHIMALRPVRHEDSSLINALKSMDVGKLRLDLLSSILNDALIKAQEVLERAMISHDDLRLYLDTLQTVQSHGVHEALQHFPIDQVMKRFADIWMSTDPPYIKAMRKAGGIIELPFKVLFDTAGKIKNRLAGIQTIEPQTAFINKIEGDLINSINRIHTKAVNPKLSVSVNHNDLVARRMFKTVEHIRKHKNLKDNQHPFVETADEKGNLTYVVAAHPVVFKEQKKLRDKDWQSAIESILSRKDVLVELSDGIEQELKNLTDSFRKEMGMWTKIRQTFSAFLNVIPATVAVTYILSTGDPVGAVGIKVKLTGLFGLHDLYALVAIPATTGLKKADKKQLDDMLGPIVQTWLNNKLTAVQDLFEQEITGGIIGVAKQAIDESDKMINQIEVSIKACGKAMIS